MVIDEWLWSDLAGENGVDKQRETFQFLEAVFIKCDRIVTVRGSQFTAKFYALSRDSTLGDPRRKIVKFFKDQFLHNPDKSQLFNGNELKELPAEIAEQVNLDDQYLVRAYLTSTADVLVTTDNSLRETLDRNGICCRAREDFVPDYISQHWR